MVIGDVAGGEGLSPSAPQIGTPAPLHMHLQGHGQLPSQPDCALSTTKAHFLPYTCTHTPRNGPNFLLKLGLLLSASVGAR